VESLRAVLGQSAPERNAGTTEGADAVDTPPRETGAGRADEESGGFMDKPGAFTEGFKQFLAQKTEGKPETIPEEAETVRRFFGGTVVK
jgi:hypothetical protein